MRPALALARPAIVYAAFLVGLFSGHRHPSMNFVAVSAQVIPVFLVVLAVEGRVFQRVRMTEAALPAAAKRLGPQFRRWARIAEVANTFNMVGILFVTVSGELAALYMIADDRINPATVPVVWGAIYGGSAALFVSALAARSFDPETAEPPS